MTNNFLKSSLRTIIASVALLSISILTINAQETPVNNAKHIYQPQPNNGGNSNGATTTKSNNDISKSAEPQVQDSLNARLLIIQDSIAKREAFVRDSIAIREAFVRDSIIKREAFVLDSIIKRKRRIDSLVFLKNKLPWFIDASLRTDSDDIVVKSTPVRIINDSILSNIKLQKLIFNFEKPYSPWESTINLSNKPIYFKVDTIKKTITALKYKNISHLYKYNARDNILRIDERSIILNNRYGKFFNLPVDSIFYNNLGQIAKIKRYHHYYQVTSTYQKGAFMYQHLDQVKQYEYTPSGRISKIEIVNFCERWRKNTPHKVCNIINYALSGSGNKYMLSRSNDPVNVFSDGNFVFEFNDKGDLASVEFMNNKKSEDWKTIVETNEIGNVSRYVYINKGVAGRTLLVNYYHDKPKAKHKVETITCYFEEDKISYRQVNNTTGKIRTRDRLTMEWTMWK